MVFVATSTSTPRSAQMWIKARVRAAYWFCRIGCTAALSLIGIGSPVERSISIAFSRGT